MLRKGARVMAIYKGQEVHGTVFKGGATEVVVNLDDGKSSLRGSPRLFQPSTKPAPIVEGAAGVVWKKDDRVEFDYNGEVLHGTVTRVAHPRVTVIGDGGNFQYGLTADKLRPSTKEIAKDPPSSMDDWSIQKYRPIRAMSEETTAFTADILYQGKVVLRASNRGHGGCNFYEGDRGFEKKLHDDARDWCIQFGIKEPSEPDDLWVLWATTVKKYGTGAADFLKTFDFMNDIPLEDMPPTAPKP